MSTFGRVTRPAGWNDVSRLVASTARKAENVILFESIFRLTAVRAPMFEAIEDSVPFILCDGSCGVQRSSTRHLVSVGVAAVWQLVELLADGLVVALGFGYQVGTVTVVVGPASFGSFGPIQSQESAVAIESSFDLRWRQRSTVRIKASAAWRAEALPWPSRSERRWAVRAGHGVDRIRLDVWGFGRR